MTLPAADRAVVEPAKVRGYLLSLQHPIGRAKAHFFQTLGFTQADWSKLQQALRELARSGEAELGEANRLWPEVRGPWCFAGTPAGRRHGDRLDRVARGGGSPIRHGVSGSELMSATYRERDTVVLRIDIPASGLKAGDLGAVVHVYAPDAVEVEFVTASGRTQALLTLGVNDVRPVRDNDLLAVRPTAVHGAA